MPSLGKQSEPAAISRELVVSEELLDLLVKGPMTQSEADAVCRELQIGRASCRERV